MFGFSRSSRAAVARGWLALACCLSMAASAGAVTLNAVDDFEGGTTLGWGGSPTSNAPDAGPAGAGDNALLVSAGNRVVTFNEQQWKGNYIAAGITRLVMDIRHANANIANLQIRLGIGSMGYGGGSGPSGSGDTYVTNYSVAVPNDDAWHRVAFNIRPSDFDPSTANGTPTPSAAAALADVTHFRILHNPTAGDFRGVQAGAEFYLDNIRAVPEPSTAALAGAAAAALAAMRRRR